MKFRISTLLWLTLAIACFFAGMSWDDVYEKLRAPRVKTATVQVGKSITLSPPSKLQVPRAIVSDPKLISAIATSPKAIRLTGKSAGTTTVSLWDSKGVQTDYSVTVKDPAQNLSSWLLAFENEVRQPQLRVER